MNARHWLCSVVAAALWLNTAQRASAQFRGTTPDDERVHAPRSDDVKPPYDRDAIQRRLNNGRDLSDADRLLQQVLNLSAQDKENLARIIINNPKLRNELTQQLLGNKELRDRLSESIKGNRLTESDKKWLQDAAKNPEKRPADTGTQPPKITPEGSRTTPDEKTSDRSAPRPPRPTEPSANESSRLQKLLSKAGPRAADLLADLGLKDDAEFVRGLLRGRIPGGNNGYLARAVGRATKVAKELPLDKIASGDFSEVFAKLHMPDLPKLNFLSGGEDTNVAVAPGSGSRGGAGAGSGTVLVWVVLALVLVAVLWKAKRVLLPTGDRMGSSWRLGPWPVRPESVRTRADVVRAFEYLAFLLLGLDARPRNHLELAAALAETGNEPVRRTVAERLSRLYERARYAPQEEALADDELRAARIDLTFLAGVSPV
jgi:hypothetical protein